jgi:hypothetical protein
MSETGSRSRTSSKSRRPDGPDLVEELKQLKDKAADVAGAVRESAGNAAGQVKQKAGEMTRAISGTIKEEAERLFDEQKGKAASKVTRYGKAIHQAAHALRAVKAEGLAEYADSAAETVEGLTSYLEERNLAQVLQDAGEVARRHPGLTIGGMFLTGFALARFVKASASREGEEGQSEDASGEESGGEEEESSRGQSRRR